MVLKANVAAEYCSAPGLPLNDLASPAPEKDRRPVPAPRSTWLVPAALLVLSAIPVAAGAARVAELSVGAAVTPDNARFFAAPLPVVSHIVSVTLYALLGAFQFTPSLRHRKAGWHRAAGRLLIPFGLVAALSGLWMNQFYALPAGDGAILYGLRLLFGGGMVLSLILGTAAIRRRNFAQHGAWMTRGYAIGLGAGTQVLTLVPWMLIVGIPGEFPRAILMGAGWVINLAIAEWVIRTRLTRATHNAAVAGPALR